MNGDREVNVICWICYEITARIRQFFCKSYRYDGEHDWESYDGSVYVCRDCGVGGEAVEEFK